MGLKVGTYYKLKIEPANYFLDRFIDENYAVVEFIDCQAFRLSQISVFEDINNKQVKYLGTPYNSYAGSVGASEALISVETKFGNVKMIMDETNLVPLTITQTTTNNTPNCVCALKVIMSSGCQCGSFKKEQALKMELSNKS